MKINNTFKLEAQQDIDEATSMLMQSIARLKEELKQLEGRVVKEDSLLDSPAQLYGELASEVEVRRGLLAGAIRHKEQLQRIERKNDEFNERDAVE